MSLSSAAISQLTQSAWAWVRTHPTSALGVGLTAVPAIEMALRSVRGLYERSSDRNKKIIGEIEWNASADLGGAILYGVCAFNPIPGARLSGAVVFVGYSLFANRSATGLKASYLASKCIYVPFDFAWDYVVTPVWKKVLSPVLSKIWNVVNAILNLFSLPKHPVWYAVALLLTAIYLYWQEKGAVNHPPLRWGDRIIQW